MAGGEDRDDRTEEATDKRRQDSLAAGKAPVSREAAIAAGLVGAVAAFANLVEAPALRLLKALRDNWIFSARFTLDTGDDVWPIAAGDIAAAARVVLPVAVCILAFVVVTTFAQARPRADFSQLAPDMSRVSPGANAARMFGAQGLGHFALNAAKLIVVSTLLVVIVLRNRDSAIEAVFADPLAAPGRAWSMLREILLALCGFCCFLACADYLLAHRRWLRDLRMTRQEVRDEWKESEGDPLVKSRLRSIARHRSRQRMMAAVPRATLIIANPSHYAIALRYRRDETAAPLVLAKGQDLLALRIREIAAGLDIPVVEDVELARAMYHRVEIERQIPPDFYRAVARIIHVLQSKATAARPASQTIHQTGA